MPIRISRRAVRGAVRAVLVGAVLPIAVLAPEPAFAAEKNKASKTELQVDSGFTSAVSEFGSRRTTAGAVVTNPRGAAACEVTVTFTLLDASGKALETQSDNVGWIPAKASVIAVPPVIGANLQVEPSSLKVTPVVDHYTKTKNFSGCDSFSIKKYTLMRVSDVAIQRGEFGLDQIVGQVTNPTSKLVKTSYVACATRAGGSIVGGDSTAILDPIPPSGTIAFDVGAIGYIPPNADSAECQITN
jgi:hypothetical protein